MFVVAAVEHMRDETTEYGKFFKTQGAALAWIDERLNGFAGCNMTFRVFELGREIPLKFDKVMEPQPAKEVKRTVMVDEPMQVRRGKR